MSFEFRDAVRRNVPLLVLVSGGTGSGKTESALRLATGLAGGNEFALIDTENGRALHKADDYQFKHADLAEPFTPERYTEALRAADDAGFPVIVIDSGSHEYEGIGGVLDIQLAEFDRMGGRDSARMASWIAPKRRHKAFVRELLRTRAHVVMTLRAEDKVDVVKDADGKTKIVPKSSLVGADGWIPICEKRLPFEATISLLLTADAPGVPKPIKLERRHADLVPLDAQLDEKVGLALAEWAAGAKTEKLKKATVDALESELLSLADELGQRPAVEEAIARRRADSATFPGWLEAQIERAKAAISAKESQ